MPVPDSGACRAESVRWVTRVTVVLFRFRKRRSTVAQQRLPMRKIREILRLKAEAGLSDQRIAEAIGSTRSTVQECVRRCREAGI